MTLPFIDEHSQPLTRSSETVWSSLLAELRAMSGAKPVARVLACDPIERTRELGGRPGEAIPGFRVVDATPGRRLALRGRHRFSEYTLTFELDGDRIRARTHAAFPGVLGKLYRAAVIGSGAHRVVVRRMLKRIARGN